VDEQLSVVRLVHYTTQEYLDSIQAKCFPDAQTEITLVLLTFLDFYYEPGNVSTNPLPLGQLGDYSQFCLAHGTGQPELQLKAMIMDFLGWAPQWQETTTWNSPWNFCEWPLQPTALWISAAANLLEIAKFLSEKGELPIDSMNSDCSAIGVASFYGHL
jgi:hypothetical protein